MIMKQQVKNGQIKRKQTCSLCFVKVFNFEENKLKIVWKNNDHYMINMDGQRSKIGGKWLLTGSYLQNWSLVPPLNTRSTSLYKIPSSWSWGIFVYSVVKWNVLICFASSSFVDFVYTF